MRRFVWIIVGLALATSAYAGGRHHRGIERLQAREAEILADVKAASPEHYAKLVELRDTAPRLYPIALHKAAMAVEVRAIDPTAEARQEEILALRSQVRGLADGFEALDAKAQKARRAEIEPLASRLFDLKLTEAEARLDVAEQRIADKRVELAAKKADKSKILAERVDALLRGEGDADDR